MHKINFITPVVLEILNVLIVMPGMPDHTYSKSFHQFEALIDLYLSAKNQLYKSNNF